MDDSTKLPRMPSSKPFSLQSPVSTLGKSSWCNDHLCSSPLELGKFQSQSRNERFLGRSLISMPIFELLKTFKNIICAQSSHKWDGKVCRNHPDCNSQRGFQQFTSNHASKHSYIIWLFNIAMENPQNKWRFLAGKIIYFYGPSIPWLC